MNLMFERQKFISSSKRVMVFLFYTCRHTDDGAHLTIFRRFPTTSRRFPNILQNFTKGHTNVAEYYPKMSELKITEDLQNLEFCRSPVSAISCKNELYFTFSKHLIHHSIQTLPRFSFYPATENYLLRINRTKDPSFQNFMIRNFSSHYFIF